MNLMIKTVTGKVIGLDVSLEATWRDIKNKLFAQEGIDINSQRLIVCRKQMNDDELFSVAYQNYNQDVRAHLILPLKPKISSDTHSLYVVVHNFYESSIEKSSLESLQYVIPLTGNEDANNMQSVFERIYAAREERIAKNKTHQYKKDHQAYPVIALVGVQKKIETVLAPSDYETQTLISLNESQLNYELLSYMLPDGTSVSSPTTIDPNLSKINQAFRLFCARASHKNTVQKNYGEIISYFDYTEEAVFEGKTAKEIQQLLQGLKSLSLGEKLNPNQPLYADIVSFDLLAMIEHFQMVKFALEGQVGQKREQILNDLKKDVATILREKIHALDKKYCANDEVKAIEEPDALLIKEASEKVLDSSCKVLAFDVSETLQTSADHDDGGLGTPMIDVTGKRIEEAYSVMIGGKETATLLQEAQKLKIPIVLVTNNGSDADVIKRTLEFLEKYGLYVDPKNYLGPEKESDGSKIPRLQATLKRFNIGPGELLFFDDSRKNIEEAIQAGFKAIRVKTANDLQKGLLAVIKEHHKTESKREPCIKKCSAPGYDELPSEIKANISSHTRGIRLGMNHLDTQSYYEQLSASEKNELVNRFKKLENPSASILADFSMFKEAAPRSFKELSITQQETMEKLTAQTREEFGGLSCSEYFDLIDSKQRIVLLQQCTQESHPQMATSHIKKSWKDF